MRAAALALARAARGAQTRGATMGMTMTLGPAGGPGTAGRAVLVATRTKASIPEPRDNNSVRRLALDDFDDLFEDDFERNKEYAAPKGAGRGAFEETGGDDSDLEIVKTSAFKQADESDSIDEFDLHPKLDAALRQQGIMHLFPVQMRTFKAVSDGEDMIVRSRTGSGKTLAFGLPVINALLSEPSSGRRPSGAPKAIVMAPTRELAKQVQNEFGKLAPSLRCVSVYGGADIGPQIRELSRPVDVVIGTPGRIYDHLSNGRLDLGDVRFAILDEADEMLKVGFKDQIDEIYSYMPPKTERQNLLFSATVAPEIRSVAKKHLNNGKLIDLVGDDNAKIPDSIEMQAMMVNGPNRMKAIANVLSLHCKGPEPKRALVFCPTKAMCNEVANCGEVSETGVKSVAMHGDMSQRLRETTLDLFRDARVQCMVATDVAARGLDIPQVDLVIHFSIPNDKDSFVHRTGRTGRAGRSGRNIVLFHQNEQSDLRDLEKLVGIRFTRHAVPGSQELATAAASDIAEKLEAVMPHEAASLEPLARKLLAEAALDGEPPVSDHIVNVVSKALALTSAKSKVLDVSALTGAADVVTLRLSGEDYVRAAGGSGKINFVKLRRTMEEIVQASISESGDHSLPRSITPGRGAVMFAAIAKDRGSVFIDVNPTIANHLLAHPDCEVVTGALPEVSMPPPRQNDHGFRKDSFKRQQRFESRGNPVFGRKTGHRGGWNNNNNNYNNNRRNGWDNNDNSNNSRNNRRNDWNNNSRNNRGGFRDYGRDFDDF